jgi:hypothetical protein
MNKLIINYRIQALIEARTMLQAEQAKRYTNSRADLISKLNAKISGLQRYAQELVG